MSWVHPFTSVIAGPTGSGQSMFVRWFVHNIKHMMTPKPDRILRCHGETYGSMVKQILNDVHDADVSVVTLFRKQ
jgi:hypothetical protein